LAGPRETDRQSNATRRARRFLGYALQNNSSVRNQDISKVFYALANKVAGQEVAWNYVRDNWRGLRST